jgi:predicted RNA-binding protein with PIN domain
VSIGDPADPEPVDAAGGEGTQIPPLSDGLLGPLLDSAGETLRRLPPIDLPPAARRLRSFDRRGLATPAARHQLRRLLEDEEELLAAAAALLLARPEAARLAAAWEEATGVGGDAPLHLVTETAADGRLPLLASVLTAGLPAGFEFGLGLVVATAAIGGREAAAADAVRAAAAGQAAAEEARRRADAARSTVEAEVARLDAALRAERQARRDTAADSTGVQARLADLEAALAAADLRLTQADRRAAAAEQRAAAAEQRAAAAEARAASAEREVEAAEAVRSVPPSRTADDRLALGQIARAAEDLAADLRHLAAGRDPVPEPDAPVRRHSSPTAPPPRRTGDSWATPPSPRRHREPAAPARSRPDAGRRRAPVRVPPGMLHDDPAAVAAMVRTPGLAVIVDGYNVSMLAWPEASVADQRDRLCDALVEFQLRVRCEVTVVFDGAEVPGVRPLRRRNLRVVFSAAGQEADDVVVNEAMFRPDDIPVIVVSSDREVRAGAEAEGATVLPADRFLQLLGR